MDKLPTISKNKKVKHNSQSPDKSSQTQNISTLFSNNLSSLPIISSQDK